jgi:hypothetical protein
MRTANIDLLKISSTTPASPMPTDTYYASKHYLTVIPQAPFMTVPTLPEHPLSAPSQSSRPLMSHVCRYTTTRISYGTEDLFYDDSNGSHYIGSSLSRIGDESGLISLMYFHWFYKIYTRGTDCAKDE